MRFFHATALSARYLFGHFRKYLFLFIALSFGFAFITVITSLSAGMRDAVFQAAQLHYGGDLFVLGFDRSSHRMMIRVADAEAVGEAIDASRLKPQAILYRTNCFEKAVLYFNGKAVRQKNVFGVDWDAEAALFNAVDMSRGESGKVNLDGGDTIIISAPVAKLLGARVGDTVLLQVDTLTGQKNSADLRITGIISDASLFGYYRSFMDRRALNALLGMDSDEYSSAGLLFSDLKGITEKAARLHYAVSSLLQAAPYMANRDDFSYQLSRSWDGVRYFVLSLPVYVSQVTELLFALQGGSYILFAMMLLIVFTSSVLTYRLILHERRMEFATMQAMGLGEGSLFAVLFFEGAILTLLSTLCGFLFSHVILFILSRFSYDAIPGFEIFLRNGRLSADFSPATIAANVGIVFSAVVLALLGPALKSLRAGLAQVLAGGE